MFFRSGVVFSALAGLLATAYIAGPVQAEMGLAPVTEGSYVSVQGGYLGTYGLDIRGHGIAPAPEIVGPDRFLQAEHGFFVGASFGHVFSSGSSFFDRVELGLDYGRATEKVDDGSPGTQNTTLANTDGTALTVTGTTASSELTRESITADFAFKKDNGGLTFGLVPFVGFTSEDMYSQNIGAVSTVFRTGDVERWTYGVMATIEPEFQLSSTVSLATKLGAGVYGYSASGDFVAGPATVAGFSSNVTDSKSGAGFRAALGAALKFKLQDGVVLSAFGEGNYWSHVATADLPEQTPLPTPTSRLDTVDMWDLRAGLRLTFALGAQ